MNEVTRNVIQFQRRDAARARAAGGGGGMSSGGGGGNDFETRLSRLETSFEHVSTALIDIRSDIRLLLGGGVGGGILLFGAIVSSHLMLQAKDDAIIAMVQSKHDALVAKDDAILERLSRLETSVAVLVARSEDREVKQSDTPGDAADSPGRRETLH